jgi:uncharacterized protein YndB with AHSA1/START domain
MTSSVITIDPERDLVLERDIDVPVALVWKAWTTPEHLRHWFVPKPWTISECVIDLRPGGGCRTVMRSPEGQEFPNVGCYLEIVPQQRLVFTDTLLAGWRPSPKPFFTAVLELSPTATGTHYKAIAIHGDPAACKTHADMGFHHGWGTVVDQLVEYIKDGRVTA